MRSVATAALFAAGLGTSAAMAADETSVSGAATFLYLATLCESIFGADSEYAAKARQLNDILRLADKTSTDALRREMATLEEVAEVREKDGSVDPARKAAFCAENEKVLSALAPEVDTWIGELTLEGEPQR